MKQKVSRHETFFTSYTISISSGLIFTNVTSIPLPASVSLKKMSIFVSAMQNSPASLEGSYL